MNNAIYAIPGFMPPQAPNFRKQIITPEDGSLLMLLHCGTESDTVSYTVWLRGLYYGAVKDPGYDYVCGSDSVPWQQPSGHGDCCRYEGHGGCCRYDGHRGCWPQFMVQSATIPKGCIIPVRMLCGCPVPVNETPTFREVPDAEKLYWYLKMPERSLPMGDSVVEVVVNGKLYKYPVQRPAYSIHSPVNRTLEYHCDTNQKNETLDVSLQKGTPGTIYLDLEHTCCGDSTLLAENSLFRAYMLLNGVRTELATARDGYTLEITIPAQQQVGTGVWKAELQLFDTWMHLAAGDLIITGSENEVQQR